MAPLCSTFVPEVDWYVNQSKIRKENQKRPKTRFESNNPIKNQNQQSNISQLLFLIHLSIEGPFAIQNPNLKTIQSLKS